MASAFLCSLKNHHSLLYTSGAVLALAAVACFLGSSILLTSAAMIVPAIIFIFSKQKQKSAEELVQDGSFSMEDDDILKAAAAAAAVLPEKEEGSFQVGDSISKTESQGCLSTSDEESEVEWPFQDKILENQDWSDGDGSISDEDSLIEISLPGGHFLSPYKDDKQEDQEEEIKRYNKFINVPKVFPNFISGSFCKQQYGLMKLLAELNEINEEENLIEIDISMGSIKCPRFEIEA